MTSQDLTIGISVVTIVSGAIHVYVGLRLAALLAQLKADSAAEIALVKQFVECKDDMLQLLNRSYVTAVLLSETRLASPTTFRGSTRCWIDRAHVRGTGPGRLRLPPTARSAAPAGVS